ncbi:hypothetical protein [Candidatus Nitrosocosmicus sp. T]
MAFRVILFLFISIGISICILTNISIAIAQEESYTLISSSEAVTSTNDAIVKAILIVSQVAVAGITFNEIFYKSLNYRRNKSERENGGRNSNDSFSELNSIFKANNIMRYSNNSYLHIIVISPSIQFGTRIGIRYTFNI